MRFSYLTHKGIAPKLAPHLLPPNFAETASNVKIYSGEIRPLQNNLYIQDLRASDSVGTIYYYLGQYWFEFPAGVDIQEGPVVNDTENRIYWTGDGLPKKTNQTEATTGVGVYPINFYPISAPTPDYAITATPGAAGTGDDRDISYIWTIVTSWGEEGLPSLPSTVATANQGQTVALTGMSMTWDNGISYEVNSWVFPSYPTGYVYRCVVAGVSGATEPDWVNSVDFDTVDGTATWRAYSDDIFTGGLAEKRIYRTNSGTTGAVWALVDTIAISATTYSDTTADDDLEATILPSEYWDPPPDDLAGLTAVGSSFAGFVGKDIFMSEPNRPHAWPYSYSVAHDIVGLCGFGNYLVVLTERNPVIFAGSHPSAMTPKVLSEPKKCLSKAGIVKFPGGMLFPAVDGLQWIDGSGISCPTKDLFTKEEWADYYPATMKGVFHQNKYFGFFSGGSGGAVVIDLGSGDVTTLDFCPSAVYVDPENDIIYFAEVSSEVLLLESGTPYPERSDALLMEDGVSKILME